MHSSARTTLRKLALFALALGAAVSAYAQEEDELEAVVVTADDSAEESAQAAEEKAVEPEAEEVEEEKEPSEDEILEKELKRLRRERDLLSVQNGIRSEKAKQ